MPTRGRPRLLAQAMAYFARQTYPNRELIIVTDGPFPGPLPAERQHIRVVEVPDRRTIGEKRNIACAFARGEIIVHWDDDDWYGSRRLEMQVGPILDGRAEITGLTCDVLLDAPDMRFWSCTEDEHARLFGEVAGGTLMYRADVWRRLARYPWQDVAEDAAFLGEARRRGARLHAIRDHHQFVYVRHGDNSWRLDPDRSAWRPAGSPMGRRDRGFYVSLNRPVERRTRPSATAGTRRSTPLVSCIMPTADRPGFVRLALDYFERQDYRRRELIVVDSGQHPIQHLVEGRRNVRYLAAEPGLPLGELRNLACEAARGSVICHWDDDDWYRPDRLTHQVDALMERGALVCGLSELRFLDIETRRAWRYRLVSGQRPWLAGATLCYRKSSWSLHRFDRLDSGEDNSFVRRFDPGEVLELEDPTIFLGIIHPGNTSPKHLHTPAWAEIDLHRIRDTLGSDLDAYLPREAPAPSRSTAGRTPVI